MLYWGRYFQNIQKAIEGNRKTNWSLWYRRCESLRKEYHPNLFFPLLMPNLEKESWWPDWTDSRILSKSNYISYVPGAGFLIQSLLSLMESRPQPRFKVSLERVNRTRGRPLEPFEDWSEMTVSTSQSQRNSCCQLSLVLNHYRKHILRVIFYNLELSSNKIT